MYHEVFKVLATSYKALSAKEVANKLKVKEKDVDEIFFKLHQEEKIEKTTGNKYILKDHLKASDKSDAK